MTDKVFPSPDRDMTTKILGQIMEYAGGSDPGWVVTSGAKIAGSARNGFGQSSSGASLDVTIDTGEAFVQGCWIDRDTSTTVTLAPSTSDQTIYVGLDLSMKNTVIVGLSAAFAANDPKMEIWSFNTDGSGVTSATDERYTAPGRGLDVPNADNASKVLNITPRWRENVLPNIQYSFASPGAGPQGLTWDGTNLWNADSATDLIYKLNTSGTVLDSFASPGTVPTGLTWDGTNLWHADADGTIYKLNTSGTVLDSWASPGAGPQGLTWDGTNLWHADSTTDLIYKLNTSGTVLDSFASPGGYPRGLAWDGTYLWNADASDIIYKLNTSGTVLDSFASPGGYPGGLAWDGTNLWNAVIDTVKIYKLSVNKYTLVAD